MRMRKAIKALVMFRLLKRLPLFPFIPLAPVALIVGSLVTSMRALGRVKHLEQRLASHPS